MTRERATRRAYTALTDEVFLQIRNGIGRESVNRDDILHDLGDAMHNISVMLQDEDKWIDDAGYRDIYLRGFDKKWATETRLNLCDFVENKVAEYMGDE